MRDGDVVLMTSFTAWAPNAKAGFKCKADEVSFFLLLGNGSRKYPGTFDPAAALHKLGWVEEPAFDEVAEQAAFEEWWSSFYRVPVENLPHARTKHGYVGQPTHQAWMSWLACAKRKAGVQ